MITIMLPRDDVGVRDLKAANLAARTTTPVAPPGTIGTADSFAPNPAPLTSLAATKERRRRDRRQSSNERRSQSRHAAVLLDTRSPHERRTHERRRQITDQEYGRLHRGIDVHI